MEADILLRFDDPNDYSVQCSSDISEPKHTRNSHQPNTRICVLIYAYTRIGICTYAYTVHTRVLD